MKRKDTIKHSALLRREAFAGAKSGDPPSSDIDTNLSRNLPESVQDAAGINEVFINNLWYQKFFSGAATLFSLATLSVTSVAASGHDKVKRENKDSIVTLNDFML